jgi:glucose-1-phosphate cytidylyltransferase
MTLRGIPSAGPLPPVLILCGGLGTRMREETEYRPKPLVEVGGRPLLWHVMKIYATHGARDFVLCLGYKGELIKDYFVNYRMRNADLTVDLGAGTTEYHADRHEDWRVTLVDTGEDAMTGARLKRAEHLLGDADLVLCTYGDGVADVDVHGLIEFHRAHGLLATVTGVRPPSRFGQLVGDGAVVEAFAEKPIADGGFINGGFFVFDRAFFERLSADAACVLERAPLEGLVTDGQLAIYRHEGFWQCADTVRDVELLRGLWDRDAAPWRTWDDRVAEHAVARERRRGDASARLAS